MNILTIPVRCVQQKWLRALALVVVFLLGVTSITALHKISIAVAEGFEKKLTSFGANIIISPKRETLTISYGGIPLGDMLLDEGRLPLAPTRATIRGIPLHERLAVVAPKLVGMARMGEIPVPVVGVDFENELELKQFWNVHGAFPGVEEGIAMRISLPMPGGEHAQHGEKKLTTPTAPVIGIAPETPASTPHTKAMTDAPAPRIAAESQDSAARAALYASSAKVDSQALAGSALGARLGLTPGARVVLGDRSLTLSGILDPTGSDDDNVMFISLATAQTILHTGEEASFIEVAALCSGCPIEDMVEQLQAALPGMDVKALRQVVAQRQYSVDFASNLALLVAFVILFSACAMVIMSMLSSVNERRREIGLLRAIGYSRGGIFAIFAAEAFGIGIVAGFLGYIAGSVAGNYVLQRLSLDAGTFPAFSLIEMVGCAAVSGLIAVLAAAFPAMKAGRVDPASALADL